MSRTARPILLLFTLLAPASDALGSGAWNDCGHRVIAAIAFEQMAPEARQAVIALLREHPAAKDATFWKSHENNSDDADLNLFLNAAVFPDDARRPGPFRRFDIGPAHYVNFRLMVRPDGSYEIRDPVVDRDDEDPHSDVIESLGTNVLIAGDLDADPEDRAVALSWLFHQVGDLHQPLHNVARFAPATPNGDRGGNDIRFGEHALHGFWDWALGGDASPENVTATAAALVAEHPRAEFFDRLEADDPAPDFVAWSKEGVSLAVRYVYKNLDPAVRAFPEPPVGYEADARAVARRQCALAGYRLADLLESIVAPIPDPVP